MINLHERMLPTSAGLNRQPAGLQSDGASNWATEAGKVSWSRFTVCLKKLCISGYLQCPAKTHHKTAPAHPCKLIKVYCLPKDTLYTWQPTVPCKDSDQTAPAHPCKLIKVYCLPKDTLYPWQPTVPCNVSDQILQMCKLICVFTAHTYDLEGNAVPPLKYKRNATITNTDFPRQEKKERWWTNYNKINATCMNYQFSIFSKENMGNGHTFKGGHYLSSEKVSQWKQIFSF